MSEPDIRRLRRRVMRMLLALGTEEAERLNLWSKCSEEEMAEINKSFRRWVANAKAWQDPADIPWLLRMLGRAPSLSVVVDP